MAWFRSKVRVELIDDTTGESFAVTEMPPGNLPESFEIDTTLHLGNDDWTVVDAQPKTRAEYAKSKTLTLRLRRLEKIDPSKMLFSYATLCDQLPPLGDTPVELGQGDYLLHEDDWRQVEFVARSDRDYVANQVAQLHEFKREKWAGHGWSEIYVRPGHPPPLESLAISLDALQNSLSHSSPGGLFVFQSFSDPARSARRVSGGFSFRIHDGTTVYGHHVEGMIASLAATVNVVPESDLEQIAEHLFSIGQLGPMLLVDWNLLQIVAFQDRQELDQWLRYVADPG